MHETDKVTVAGENFLGLIGLATDKYAILSPQFPHEGILKVPTLKTKAYGTNLIGLFCVGNSNGLLVPYFIADSELDAITRFMKGLGVNVTRLEDKYTALGNMMACNNKGAFASTFIREYKAVEDTLGVEVVSGDVAGRTEVGAYVVATNKGFLAHPDAEGRLGHIAEALKVKGMVGTVNCGVPFVKAGIIANSNGYLTGGLTTGIEMQRIDDALGFV